MREQLSQDIKAAMKGGEKARLAVLRLIAAAIKDRDLGVTGERPAGDKISDAEILALLQKMVKQRRESITAYRDAGRSELADQEAAEIAIIDAYLPKQMDDASLRTAVTAVVAEVKPQGVKDMGRVMAALKERFPGQMDIGKASALVKELLK